MSTHAVEHRFGPYGGRYVPETLVPALDELERAWVSAREDAASGEELGAIAGVLAHADPGRLELGERRHQRLGDVLAAVGPVAVLDARLDAAHDATSSSTAGAGSARASGAGSGPAAG
ncbi:MAG TPA: hypothetical protein VF517_17490, partial [Thermoleophilaceae bacterium]